MFGDLANQKTDFKGVQSKLQLKINYRSKNKRLEMKFFMKKHKFNEFKGFNIANLSHYHELNDFHQKIGKKHIHKKIFTISVSSREWASGKLVEYESLRVSNGRVESSRVE